MQLKITQSDIQVWKSKIFEMLVLEAINATETLEQDYPNFVDKTIAKLQELEERIDNIGGGGIAEESDPTVPTHVKNITEQDIQNWDNKSEFSGNYEDLENKPEIPSTEGFATEEYVNDLVGNIEILLSNIADESEAI